MFTKCKIVQYYGNVQLLTENCVNIEKRDSNYKPFVNEPISVNKRSNNYIC